MATITTADGRAVEIGHVVFDYYSMRLGEILTEPDSTGWFFVRHLETNHRALLNGERICTIRHAMRMGWQEREDSTTQPNGGW